jgi:hypothetical protein
MWMKNDELGLGRSKRHALKHLSVCLLFAAAIQSLCWADVTKLSAEDRRVLQDSSRFHEVHTTSDLPPAILTFVTVAGTASSQNQAKIGTRLTLSRIRPSQVSA